MRFAVSEQKDFIGFMRLALVIILALFPYMCLQAKEEVSAWNRTVPRGPDDLLEIQERMQSLLPKVRKALVSIESNGGAGSGIIVSEDGLVLTAAHVIGSSGKTMSVRLPNGKRLPAVSLGGSEISDGGMLKITKSGSWPFVEMAPRGSASIGDWCFGLGHPGGFDKERGIVIRIGRVIAKKEETMRTDSRLLGGDSGGPLFDFDGRVIGIHSRISKEPDENFHVPIESFRANWDFFKDGKLFTMEQLSKGGFLGVACEEREKGIFVTEALDRTPAKKAGLKSDDLIVSIDGERIETTEELIILIGSKKPGMEIKLEYRREDKSLSSKIKLGERPKRSRR